MESAPLPTPPNLSFWKRPYPLWMMVVLVSVTGAVAYTIGQQHELNQEPQNNEQRLNSAKYQFINPLLDQVEFDSYPLLTREVDELKEKIDEITADAVTAGKLTDGSVYYRDLNNGPWFSAGELEPVFRPASLFKVPVMIAYFKQAESDPTTLSRTIRYERPYMNEVLYRVDSSDKTIELGKTYTVLELIEYMIVYSDNLAAYLLLDNIDNVLITQVFSDLAIPLPNNTAETETITPRRYASFFRILYNATYLNRTYSEMALEILSRSSFKHGIRSVLNDGTTASLKYGITSSDSREVQLHECGIVYWHQDRPHLLCIMSSGTNYDSLRSYLESVAVVVQDTLTAERRKP